MTGLFTLHEAARAVGANVLPEWDGIRLDGVSTDTRTIRPGDLFVALKGNRFNGHDFLEKAFELGAAAALVSETPNSAGPWNLVVVADTLKSMGDLAAYLRRRAGITVLALTGSNGKTTTKEMLHRIVQTRYNTLATQGNFNNLVGLPLTLFRLKPEHEAAVLEMGMNAPNEIARLTEIARPDVGLVTNVAPAHLEGLGSIEGVARAKGELFRGLESGAVAAVNLDDPLVAAEAKAFSGRQITFGLSPEAMVRAEDVTLDARHGCRFRLVTPDLEQNVSFGLLGRHNVVNALGAVAAAMAAGVPAEAAGPALEGFRPFPCRLEIKTLADGAVVIDDTYNANPASAAAALEVLAAFDNRGRRMAVLGDMFELGPAGPGQHAAVGRKAAGLNIDLLAAVGPNGQYMAEAAREAGMAPGRVHWFENTEKAAVWLASEIKADDCLLVKGSRGMKMETIVNRLNGKGDN